MKGYTLVELVTCIVGFVMLGLMGFGLYAAVHFILKLW